MSRTLNTLLWGSLGRKKKKKPNLNRNQICNLDKKEWRKKMRYFNDECRMLNFVSFSFILLSSRYSNDCRIPFILLKREQKTMQTILIINVKLCTGYVSAFLLIIIVIFSCCWNVCCNLFWNLSSEMLTTCTPKCNAMQSNEKKISSLFFMSGQIRPPTANRRHCANIKKIFFEFINEALSNCWYYFNNVHLSHVSNFYSNKMK